MSSLTETYRRRLWALVSDPARVWEFLAGKSARLLGILRSENWRLAPWHVLDILVGRKVIFSWLSRYFVRDVFDNSMVLDLSYGGITHELFFGGVREPVATDAFRRGIEELLRETDEDIVFLEVGANIGYYTLQVASLAGGRGTTYAVEPHPDNRDLLEANVIINGVRDDVVIVDGAVGACDGTATLSLSARANHHTVGEPTTNLHRYTGETLDVPLRRATTILRENDVPARSVNVVRMDVDGYESEVFRGMEEILLTNSPLLLFVEVHADRTDAEYVVETLRAGGFEVLSASDERWDEVDLSSFDDIYQYDSLRLVLKRGW